MPDLEKLAELQRMLHGLLPDDVAEGVVEYIEYHEWEVAVEFMCDYLSDYEIPMPREAKPLLRELADEMHLDRPSIGDVLNGPEQ